RRPREILITPGRPGEAMQAIAHAHHGSATYREKDIGCSHAQGFGQDISQGGDDDTPTLPYLGGSIASRRRFLRQHYGLRRGLKANLQPSALLLYEGREHLLLERVTHFETTRSSQPLSLRD